MVVDLLFSLQGQTLPLDHAYGLYAALSRVLGDKIHGTRDVGVFSIRGMQGDKGKLALTDQSALRLRVPDGRIKDMLALAGKMLEIDGHRVRLGVPRVMGLVPAATLVARMVEIKLSRGKEAVPVKVTPEGFLAAARKKLTDPPHEDPGKNGLGLSAGIEVGIPRHESGKHAGEPQRRILRVKGRIHAGFTLIVSGLSAEESIRLQEKGIGGRRVMGCGLFLGVRESA